MPLLSIDPPSARSAQVAVTAPLTKAGNTISISPISNANIAANAAIEWAKISKVGAIPSDVGAAPAVHTHTIADVSGLQTSIDNLQAGKANSTDVQTALNLKAPKLDPLFTGTLWLTDTGAAGSGKGVEVAYDVASDLAFVDFHSGDTHVGFDSRIISTSGSGSSGGGSLAIQAGAITLNAPAGNTQLTNAPAAASNSSHVPTTAWVRTYAASTFAPLLNAQLTGTLWLTDTGVSGTGKGIEVGYNTATDLAFIDFHSGDTHTDFDARIISGGGSGVSAGGSLTIQTGAITFNCPSGNTQLTNAPPAGSNDSHVPTTAWVRTYAGGTFAPLASPALTGTPTTPTAALNTNNTQVASTQYVDRVANPLYHINDVSTGSATFTTVNSWTPAPGGTVFTDRYNRSSWTFDSTNGRITIPSGAANTGYYEVYLHVLLTFGSPSGFTHSNSGISINGTASTLITIPSPNGIPHESGSSKVVFINTNSGAVYLQPVVLVSATTCTTTWVYSMMTVRRLT